MISYAMNAQTNLQLHLERYEYKRGRYKGDAPADASRRARTHFRVTPDHTITFHTTNILTARPDGTIRLHTNGWHDSPTTREAMNHAIFVAVKKPVYMHSKRYNGLSQTAIGQHRYYDGMVFDSDMQLVSSPAPFSAYATDREATKALRDAAAPLRAMLPILVAAEEGTRAPTHQRHALWWTVPGRNDTDRAMHAFENPEHWPAFVSYFHNPGDTHQTLWARAYARLTVNMRKVVDV